MMASGVRPFEEPDIPACAELHRKVFGITADPRVDLPAAYHHYFRSLFLDNPGRAAGVGPLVCEENGKIIGFLGAIPRPLRFRGRSVLALLTSQFVVDPASRSLAGVKLMKACLAGPQDLTFADESNDPSRGLWERLEGKTALVHSLHWLALTRPALRMLEMTHPPQLLAAAGAGVARLLDSAVGRIPRSPWRRALPSGLQARPLEPLDLLRFWHECQASVIPDHSEATLLWTLDRIRQLKNLHGELHAVTLWTADGRLAGAYAYHAHPGDVSQVVLFASQPALDSQVLDHLLASATEAGLSALTGRVPPRHVHAFSRASCLMSNRPKWTLVHSRDEAIVNAILSGDDALSAIDGEWFTHFNFRAPLG